MKKKQQLKEMKILLLRMNLSDTNNSISDIILKNKNLSSINKFFKDFVSKFEFTPDVQNDSTKNIKIFPDNVLDLFNTVLSNVFVFKNNKYNKYQNIKINELYKQYSIMIIDKLYKKPYIFIFIIDIKNNDLIFYINSNDKLFKITYNNSVRDPKFTIHFNKNTTISIEQLNQKNIFKMITKKLFSSYDLFITYNIIFNEKEGYYFVNEYNYKYEDVNDTISIFNKSLNYFKRNLIYNDGFMYYFFGNKQAFEFYRNNNGKIENIITFVIFDDNLFFLNNIEKPINKMDISNGELKYGDITINNEGIFKNRIKMIWDKDNFFHFPQESAANSNARAEVAKENSNSNLKNTNIFLNKNNELIFKLKIHNNNISFKDPKISNIDYLIQKYRNGLYRAEITDLTNTKYKYTINLETKDVIKEIIASTKKDKYRLSKNSNGQSWLWKKITLNNNLTQQTFN
jgi:hypothetical protein